MDLDEAIIKEVFTDPVKFAENLLVHPRDRSKKLSLREYQGEYLKDRNLKKHVRYARRMGKSLEFAIESIYYAFTDPNSKTIIIAPFSEYVDQVFLHIRNIMSDFLVQSVQGKQGKIGKRNPQLITLSNKSRLRGQCAGQGGQSVRSMGADHLFLDECVLGQTEVYTMKGKKRIKDVDVGDKIFNFLNNNISFNTVLKSKCTGKKSTTLYRTESGRQIVCTPDHKFMKKTENLDKFERVQKLNRLPVYIGPTPYPKGEDLMEARVLGCKAGGGTNNDRFFYDADRLGIKVYEDVKADKVSEKILNGTKEMKREYLAGFAASVVKFLNIKGIEQIFDAFPKLKIKKGSLIQSEDNYKYFLENIGYRYHNDREKMGKIELEYIKSNSDVEVREWVKDRLVGDVLFEKIVERRDIGKQKVYNIKVKEKHAYIADDFVSRNCDYFTEDQITAILPLLQENKDATLAVSSTPRFRDKFFWNTAHDASFTKHHRTAFANPVFTTRKQFKEQGRDPRNSQEAFAERNLSEEAFQTEILAKFPESGAGVFKDNYVNHAITPYVYSDVDIGTKYGPRMLGVDWNSKDKGVFICILEWVQDEMEVDRFREYRDDDVFTDDNIIRKVVEDKIRIIHREVISKNEYTQMSAVNRIIELQDMFSVDQILADKGYGATNIEMLHKRGDQIGNKVLRDTVGVDFGSKLKVKDPITNEETKKYMKPFLVHNTKKVLETKSLLISLDEDNKINEGRFIGDNTLVKNMRLFAIDHFTSSGRPVYTSEHDHVLDCFMIALHGYTLNYSRLFKRRIINTVLGSSKSKVLKDSDRKIDSSKYRTDPSKVKSKKYQDPDPPGKKDDEMENEKQDSMIIPKWSKWTDREIIKRRID